MTDFDVIAGALRGEALRETAAALFAALSGEPGGAAAAAGFGEGDAAVPARGGLGFAPGGAAARREVGAARFAAENAPAQAAEMAAVRREAAEPGGFGGAVYGAAVEGSGGGAARRAVLSRTAEAARSEGFGAEALSEAVRRDSRRYDRRLE